MLAGAGSMRMSAFVPVASVDCQACGACCCVSATWPRFSLEDDDQLAAVPPAFVAADESGMRCVGDRCSALQGVIGTATACGIYDARPLVCRDCVPGGEDCAIARSRHGMPVVAPSEPDSDLAWW